MANSPSTTGSSLRQSGAAVSQAQPKVSNQGARSAWDRAYHEYRRLKLRMEAYYALGPMAWANEACGMAGYYKDDAPEEYQESLAALRQEEEVSPTLYEPVNEAALVLMRLPAPDLEAVAVKIALHKECFEACTEYDRLAWSCIELDLQKL